MVRCRAQRSGRELASPVEPPREQPPTGEGDEDAGDDAADPAGGEKGQVYDDSPFDALRAHGYLTYPASTNNVEPRLLAVEKALRTSIMGGPMVNIRRAGCPTLVRAMGSMYRYKKKRDGSLEDRPDKAHPWSDVADCLQYACLGANMNLTGRILHREMRRSIQPRRISAAGWT